MLSHTLTHMKLKFLMKRLYGKFFDLKEQIRIETLKTKSIAIIIKGILRFKQRKWKQEKERALQLIWHSLVWSSNFMNDWLVDENSLMLSNYVV